MARKIFISYKYSEAQDLRDEILHALGDDATFYKGETADSPDLTDTKVGNIKIKLKDMMYNTSVTIVIVSPNMTKSKWIDWEIEYSLKEISRDGRTSKTNGVVGVIMKYNGSYDWLISTEKKDDGCSLRTFDSSKLYDVIAKNRFNRIGDEKYACKTCNSMSRLEGSYISLIDEEDFISNPSKYIENAYEKSQNLDSFELVKKV